MRIADILSIVESDEVANQVIDFLTIMDAENVDSIPLATLVKGLQNQGVTVDRDVLFDILDNLAIVKNIKDDIVYFNSTSDESEYGTDHDPEKDDKVVSGMARKQVKKELNK